MYVYIGVNTEICSFRHSLAILEHISRGYGDTVLLSVTVVTCSYVCLVKSILCPCGQILCFMLCNIPCITHWTGYYLPFNGCL